MTQSAPPQSTVWQVARRPRWLAALALALVIAGLFAALGQWQVGRAVEAAAPDSGVSETVLPLDEVAAPSRPITATADGQRVAGSSEFVPGGAEILGGRLNGEQPGWWVIARTRTADADLVVAYGWTADEDQARSVAERLNDGAEAAPTGFTGRLVANEAAEVPAEGTDPMTLTALSIPALINRWPDPPLDVYQGYVVVDQPVSGLEAIDSPARVTDVSLNWLNVFYAIEWVVFAGFALYLWFRLVRDAWERETEEALEAAELAQSPVTASAP
ncbi:MULTISPECIES: SURF1 family cytochrome oxidase biogenesis protein [unclassified Rathayibacter]|uniref:SURF1 family protein n=1 Tax=unclassified Rathayibacter TaxID=2609250 RepID=UPI0010E3CC72|nr:MULTISPECIES: SURF1 family cytochrome oxidase biogenesis protein [unclassified Rathayibacter]TCL84863.1 cytochrome oxidase assembly protein ShyY1 [Rathayibacter sp. PhB192]TCM30581.1 cytochrome oxidase assembly protein ShyY1 [Rathayibacter sp. PhB179]